MKWGIAETPLKGEYIEPSRWVMPSRSYDVMDGRVYGWTSDPREALQFDGPMDADAFIYDAFYSFPERRKGFKLDVVALPLNGEKNPNKHIYKFYKKET